MSEQTKISMGNVASLIVASLLLLVVSMGLASLTQWVFHPAELRGAFKHGLQVQLLIDTCYPQGLGVMGLAYPALYDALYQAQPQTCTTLEPVVVAAGGKTLGRPSSILLGTWFLILRAELSTPQFDEGRTPVEITEWQRGTFENRASCEQALEVARRQFLHNGLPPMHLVNDPDKSIPVSVYWHWQCVQQQHAG